MTSFGLRKQDRIAGGGARGRAPLFLLSILALLALGAPGWAAAKYGTWDQFYYKVQLPMKAAAPASQVTLLIYHSYPESLHEVRAVGRGESLTVTSQPALRKELPPTEIVSLPFALKSAAATGDTVTLHVDLQAAELPGTKTVEVTVPLTAAAERRLNEQLSLPVGGMEVRVGGLGNQTYLLYLALTLGLLGWLVWRQRRLARR